MQLTDFSNSSKGLRGLAASLDERSSLSLSFTELWMGGFFRQCSESKKDPNASAASQIAKDNVVAMNRLLNQKLPDIVESVGGSLMEASVRTVQGSVDRHNPKYVMCPDVKLSVGKQSDCILRIRANPCSPMSWTKLWLYVFRQDSDSGISFQDGIDFMDAAEDLCAGILDLVGESIEARFHAESTENLVTIYNFGSKSKIVKDLVGTASAEDWDRLASAVGSETLVGVCDLLGQLARDGVPGGFNLAPTDSAPEMPFISSIVDVEDSTPKDGPCTYQGLYTQRLYDGEAKVRISGIAAGDTFEDWHKPAQPFALNYVVSL